MSEPYDETVPVPDTADDMPKETPVQHACGKHYIETVWGRGYVLRDPSEGTQKVAA